jgi:hypothetical protein
MPVVTHSLKLNFQDELLAAQNYLRIEASGVGDVSGKVIIHDIMA